MESDGDSDASESGMDDFDAKADDKTVISDASTYYDSDGGTEDGYDVGPEETRSIFYHCWSESNAWET